MSTAVSKPVRVGLIGCGGIAGAHAKGYVAHADKIRVVAMADVSPDNLAKRGEQLQSSPKGFADWKAMLGEMGDQLDAVDICLPHHLHAPAILDSAAAGKHILCEKPMCMSLAEADQIAQAVKAAGVTYMSAHNQLFMPVVQEAKKLIDSGRLGRIMHIRSQDCFHARNANWGWRSNTKTQGGGELIDTGYHPSYRLLHLAGSPAASIKSVMARFEQPIEGEDTAAVLVRFENGTIGEILTSWAFDLPHGTQHIHVIGTKGQLFGTNNTLHHLSEGEKAPKTMEFDPVDTFTAEIEHFADCLLEGKRPIHGVEEGRAVLELILGASKDAAGWA